MLPAGWEARQDPNQANATYYVNQYTGASQWDVPTMPAQGGPPPAGVPPPAGYGQPQPAANYNMGQPADGQTYNMGQPAGQPAAAYGPPPTGGGGQYSTGNPQQPTVDDMGGGDPLSNMFGMNKIKEPWMAHPYGVECDIPGLEKLQIINKVTVKQTVELLEAAADQVGCGCCEGKNSYKLFNDHGEVVYFIREESDFLQRCCCSPNHRKRVEMYDQFGNSVLKMEQPCKVPPCCPVCLPQCQNEMRVYAGKGDSQNYERLNGIIHQPACGGCFNPTVDLYEEGRVEGQDGDAELGEITEFGNQIGSFVGPTCCIGGICCDVDFNLTMEGSEEAVAVITKEGIGGAADAARELFTDADTFVLTFNDENMPIKTKANVIAANMMLDYMFFEGGPAVDIDCPMSSEPGEKVCGVHVTFCDLYCCGCLHPCGCGCDQTNPDEDDGYYSDGGDPPAEYEEPPPEEEYYDEPVDDGDYE